MVDLRGVNDRDIYESIINRTFDIEVLDAFARKKIE
jgi:hypothetical protein